MRGGWLAHSDPLFSKNGQIIPECHHLYPGVRRYLLGSGQVDSPLLWEFKLQWT